MSQTISIHLNGEVTQICQPQTLAQLVDALALDVRQVAIEHNRRIVQRGALADIVIASGDEIEIVEFIGGG